MRWIHNIEAEHYHGYQHVWQCDFGGHRFKIYKMGSWHFRLWCHDISSSNHWFLRSAKRQAKEDALEYCLTHLSDLDEFVGEVDDKVDELAKETTDA